MVNFLDGTVLKVDINKKFQKLVYLKKKKTN